MKHQLPHRMRRGSKKLLTMLLAPGLLLLASLIPCLSFAQTGPSKKIGTVNEIFGNTNMKSSKKHLGTTAGDLPVTITSDTTKEGRRQLSGIVENAAGSNVNISLSNGQVNGTVIVPAEQKAYIYESDATGNVYAQATDINKVICVQYPTAPAGSVSSQAVAPDSYVFNLQSLPGAQAVIKLDFDGEYVVDPAWNGGQPIDAQPALLSESEIYEVFKLISEDFKPFQLNITTTESVYQSAPANQRMRVIFTPTNTAAPGSGGVAYVGSFTWGTNTPCWVFNSGIKGAGEAGSHEAGHTLGLLHDGRNFPDGTHEEYYGGQGIWAPIMGVGYGRPIVQWSKGEYQYANDQEDDIAIITTNNGFSFRTDDVGNSIATSKLLSYDPSGNLIAANNFGIISTRSDVDVYRFTLTSQRTINLNVKPHPDYPDLDVLLTLQNSGGAVLQTANQLDRVDASIFATLAAGTYYLTIDGTGNRDPFTDGYSDYGSEGEYTVSGTLNLPAGINGPSCVMPNITYTYILNPAPPTNITSITWWANGDARVTVDPNDRRIVYVTFTSYNPGSVSLGAVVNYNTFPWSQSYYKTLQFNGCPVSARTGSDDLSDDQANASALDQPQDKIVDIKIFDMTGQEVLSGNNTAVDELLLCKDLPTGIYIIRTITESGGHYTRKVFKEGR